MDKWSAMVTAPAIPSPGSTATGENQYANFDVDENSPLCQLLGGESVTIRYDPASPDRFYYRDLLKTRVNSVLRTTLAVLIVLACASVGGWLLFKR